MPFSARKMHFFDKNGNLTHCSAQLRADVKELFFREVILHQFLKRKKWALLGKNVQAILTLLKLAQKVPFLEDLKKKNSKSDWNQRHIVYVTQIHDEYKGLVILYCDQSCNVWRSLNNKAKYYDDSSHLWQGRSLMSFLQSSWLIYLDYYFQMSIWRWDGRREKIV